MRRQQLTGQQVHNGGLGSIRSERSRNGSVDRCRGLALQIAVTLGASLIAGCGGQAKQVRQQAETFNQAILDGDIERMVSLTDPQVIQESGEWLIRGRLFVTAGWVSWNWSNRESLSFQLGQPEFNETGTKATLQVYFSSRVDGQQQPLEPTTQRYVLRGDRWYYQPSQALSQFQELTEPE